MPRHVIAVFDGLSASEPAIAEFRSMGVPHDHLSILTRQDTQEPIGSETALGFGVGAGIGALAGLGAILIPGVGAFLGAGAIAATLAGSTAAGAIVGGTMGATGTGPIDHALSLAGCSPEESRYFGLEVDRGAVLVSIDLDGLFLLDTEARSVLFRHGGRAAEVPVPLPG